MQSFDDIFFTMTSFSAKKLEKKQNCWVKKKIQKLKTVSKVP